MNNFHARDFILLTILQSSQDKYNQDTEVYDCH